MSRILLVAQISPPSEIVAARRTAGMVKYLGRRGHEITLLTSGASGAGPVEGAARTVRTRDLAGTALNRRRRGDAPPTGDAAGLETWLVPDPAIVSWLPFALPAALRLGTGFDCVITSAPPASVHAVGLALRARGVPWIADFRDGWTFDPPRPPWRFAAQRRLDAALERAAVGRADAAMAVTGPLVADLRERLGADAHLVTNGYDPEESAPPGAADGLLAPDRHSLVHTGRAGVSGRSPAVLLEALRRAPDLDGRIEVVFAGNVSGEERALLAGSPAARSLGVLPRPRALALQRAADSLLVIASGASERSVATGKLFEYLAAGRPIVVLGDRSVAARIVAECGAGFALPADDPDAIAAGLRRLLADATERRPEAVARYSWAVLAERVEALVATVS